MQIDDTEQRLETGEPNERELSKWDTVRDPDLLTEHPSYGEKHPTPEQLLFRMAIDKVLMRDQKKIWEMYNYDKLRPSDIARKMKVSPQAIGKRIKVIEQLLIKWCQEHKEVYDVLKEAEENDNNQGC